MSGGENAALLMAKAREAKDDLEARLYLAAAVHDVAFRQGARSVVSGGTAVDFFAGGAMGRSEAYPALWRASGDVDLVVFAVRGYDLMRVKVLKALESELGLRPQWLGETARVVEVPDFPFGLEIVADELNLDPRGENVFIVLLEGKWPVTLRGPEDVILAYAESGWRTHHTRDWERALAVYSAMREHLDLDHLLQAAQARNQSHVIAHILAMRPLQPRV